MSEREYVFDGSEAAEASLPPPVVGVLDPVDDFGSKVVSGVPALLVQNLLLQQREELCIGCVVAC